MTRYTKTIAALLGAIGTWGITAADEGISQSEWFGLLVALATALGVYSFPNTPPDGEPADPEISEQGAVEAGSLALGLIIGAVLVLLLL